MKAWVVRDSGPPWESFVREDRPVPGAADMEKYCLDLVGLRERRSDEAACGDFVVLRVLAAALAWPDVTMATGEYPVPIARPYVSGQEAVGIVEETSPSMREWLGRRVVAFTPQPFGSFAEYCIATAPTVFDCPDAFSDEEAAGFFIPSHTAWHAVHRRGRVQAGEVALVLGAAGGVPSAALQLCIAAGARSIALAAGSAKVAFCEEMGASVAIDYSQADWPERVRAETGGRGVDVIIDFVQGQPGARARTLLAVEGRHVMAGHAAGLLPVHPNEFYLQNFTLVGCCMGYGYGEALPEIEATAHAGLMKLVREGRFRPRVGRVVGFDEIPEAFRDLVERRVRGRLVTRIATD